MVMIGAKKEKEEARKAEKRRESGRCICVPEVDREARGGACADVVRFGSGRIAFVVGGLFAIPICVRVEEEVNSGAIKMYTVRSNTCRGGLHDDSHVTIP